MMAETKGDEEIKQDILIMREWLMKQPHLPHNIDDRFLRRFLHSCYYSIERTKKCMELFFTIRTSCVDMLANRDPLSEEMRTVFSITNLASLRLSDKSNLLIWQLNDPGMEKYDYIADAKLFFSQSDIWIFEDDFLESRDIVLLDVKDISMKFLKKFNISVAKKLGQYQQEALPVRLKEVHLINCPSFIDNIFTFMKPLMPQEMCKMIHFHSPNSETLYKYVRKEDLPADFGGQAGTMEEHMRAWVQRFESKRDLLTNEKLWIADKTKGPKNTNHSQSALQSGSFRKLELD